VVRGDCLSVPDLRQEEETRRGMFEKENKRAVKLVRFWEREGNKSKEETDGGGLTGCRAFASHLKYEGGVGLARTEGYQSGSRSRESLPRHADRVHIAKRDMCPPSGSPQSKRRAPDADSRVA
jgi:hypothetical protein